MEKVLLSGPFVAAVAYGVCGGSKVSAHERARACAVCVSPAAAALPSGWLGCAPLTVATPGTLSADLIRKHRMPPRRTTSIYCETWKRPQQHVRCSQERHHNQTGWVAPPHLAARQHRGRKFGGGNAFIGNALIDHVEFMYSRANGVRTLRCADQA